MSRSAERMAILVKGNVIRGIFRRLCPAVDVDEGVDIPVFQQPVSWDVVMGGIKADIFRGKAKAAASKIIYGKKEIFTVMAFGIRKFEEDGEFNLKGIIPGAEHIKCMAEVPVLVVRVPPPFCIRIGIMAWAAVAEGAGRPAGGKMPSERGGMGDQSSAIAGECKGSRINKPHPNGREDSEEEKDPLESRLWVWGSRTSIHDITDDVIGGNRGGVLGFYQLAVRTNDFFRLLSIFGGRKERGTGVEIPGPQPETVHKVIVRAKWRKFIQGRAADEECQGNRVRKDFGNP